MALATTPSVRLLGGFALRTADGSSLPGPDPPRAVQRLLARLALSRCPDRDVLAGRLWPEVPEDRAHANLRSTLWRLRQLAPGLVEGTGTALVLAGGVRVDAHDLEAWAARVTDPRTGDGGLTVPGPELLGRLLPGWPEEWVVLERERLRQLRLHALELLADRLTAAGRPGEAVRAAGAAVREEPLRESAHRSLVRARLAAGDEEGARRVYERFRQLLAVSLGAAPSPSMTGLLAGASSGSRGGPT
ncbi:DNA-binding transcriptional activator of the SARP family [Blastococcus aggregatus]|uniref:DNA-binding transcriptional activator of the SARP family n=1 Tax=Blastococcus aggregatus TaxID=38502 RepID=A0A285V6F7_9ACTN|nr:BTAD domain-containing putative transcriptional regulator [Blastococcus aggregatus]SOC49639.1 DNA-binding transcriptional activator of the SARP family [Blastococcus aggregatus]